MKKYILVYRHRATLDHLKFFHSATEKEVCLMVHEANHIRNPKLRILPLLGGSLDPKRPLLPERMLPS